MACWDGPSNNSPLLQIDGFIRRIGLKGSGSSHSKTTTPDGRALHSKSLDGNAKVVEGKGRDAGTTVRGSNADNKVAGEIRLRKLQAKPHQKLLVPLDSDQAWFEQVRSVSIRQTSVAGTLPPLCSV